MLVTILQSRSRELWVRQLVNGNVYSTIVAVVFLQCNFVDPGWGAEFSIFYGGPALPSLAPALELGQCDKDSMTYRTVCLKTG